MNYAGIDDQDWVDGRWTIQGTGLVGHLSTLRVLSARSSLSYYLTEGEDAGDLESGRVTCVTMEKTVVRFWGCKMFMCFLWMCLGSELGASRFLGSEAG